MRIAIIGGGPAGIFAAIHAKSKNQNADVIVFEKTGHVLHKVKISGGGRCNVTHNCIDLDLFSRFYPRGEKFLKKAFHVFSSIDTIRWFSTHGVELKIEEDNRMFPVSNQSQTVIDCLMHEVEKLGIQILYNVTINKIEKDDKVFILYAESKNYQADSVVVTTGGSRSESGWKWLASLGMGINKPVPSLFSFNIHENKLHDLTGLSVNLAFTKISGTNFSSSGPLLVTHWGLSGPSILKLSSFAARELADKDYQFTLLVNWTGLPSEESNRQQLEKFIKINSARNLSTANPFGLASRLWEYLLDRSGLQMDKKWSATGTKEINRLIHRLMNDEYKVEGKTTYKEEFVTCGGVLLSEIDVKTMGSKKIPGLYFAGEVLDIDGLTGGFNFQNAWTTSYIAGNHAASFLP